MLNRFRPLIALAVAVILIMPVIAQSTSEPSAAACIAEGAFDPETDYFTEETSIEYAESFEVEYFNSYKVVTVTTPWQGAESDYTYVLVQCGAPTPDEFEGDPNMTIVEVPIDTIATMSTTYLPHLVELDLLDSLVAVDELDFVYSEDVREYAETADVVEIGGGSLVNVEQAIDVDPDLIMTYGFGGEYDAHPTLIAAGLEVALNADYTETTPLGRAEWVKFTAMFFNREADADALFDQIADDYNALVDLAADAEPRPTVLVNGMFQDTWYVSGGGSYAAQFIEDAGGDYLFADDESVGGVPLSFETVFDRAQDADVWLNANFWLSLDEGLAEDTRYAEFAPFQNEQIYNNNARVTNLGGNDYTESGVLRPDLVLADLIAIFHPELLPDHEFTYYRRLE